MIKQALQGLGVVAFGDPQPGPGVRSGLSYSPGTATGRIRLVGSKGQAREATYQQVYLTNPFVWAATNYIARGIGRLPLHLYELDAAADKRRIRADLPGTRGGAVQLDQILNNPQGRISRAAFWGGTVRQRLILGNALWEIRRDRGAGMPTGLERIPWQQVTHVEEDAYGNALWYEVRTAGDRVGARVRQLAPSDVVHFGLGTEADQACGVSLLESCHATLALHDALLRHLLAYFENSARVSGHLHVERATKDRVKEIRELMTALYASPENAGQILVSSGKWEPMGDSPASSQIAELLTQSRIEIASAFQVPPPVLGLLEHAIRANVKEMREQFGRETIGPWATEIEDELEAQLIAPLFPSVFCELQLAEQLRPDLEARALVYQRLMWVMSIDEIRALENMPPLKIAGVTDVPWVASGAMPVTTASEGPSRPSSSGEPNGFSTESISTLLTKLDAFADNVNGHRHEVLTP